jgi:N-acetylmuramoyl-L-alanine amidase
MGYQGWVEDEFNNDIVVRTRDYLVSLGAQVDLISTMDAPVDIDEVVEAYEGGGYDLAVSVHFNSVASASNPASPSGTYAYYAYPNSQLLAKCLLGSICEVSGLKNNGVVRDSFRVTRTYTCPSVLMEMAFMCNPQDYDWMCEDYNRQALAKGLALGILEYLTQ